MNSSADNLISLSDSGVGSSLSTSVIYSASRSGGGGESSVNDFNGCVLDMSIFEGGAGNVNGNTGGIAAVDANNSGNGLLIDFSDEVQVPMPQGILLQAEIDDTFGIFSMAQQSSQGSIEGEDNNGRKEEDDDDDAAKLVRSFTSGRRSDGVKKKDKQKDEQRKSETDHDGKDVNKQDGEGKNDSVASIASDQTTIVESNPPSPNLSGDDDDENEKGIMEEKMDLTSNSNLTQSIGSDSEILDVDNLSGFSIPEEDMDGNKFIEEIRKKDMAASSTTAAIVNKIKLELLQDEDDEEEDNTSTLSSLLRRDEQRRLLSDISRPSLATTLSSYNSRLSSSSTVSSISSRSSVGSQKNSTMNVGDGPATATTSGSTATPSAARARLSSSSFGSPIRASYPISNRYFMPTPKAKTPSAGGTFSRDDFHRDRITDSIYSPNRTRVMLITGDSRLSPCRVPVRKSISAETLHYELRSPVREAQRHVIKFSTPSASSRPRHSVSINSNLPDYPNFFGDDRPATAGRQRSNTYSYDNGDMAKTDKSEEFVHYRKNRVSFASSPSNSSIHSLSPTSSCIEPSSTKEVENLNLSISSQFNRINLNDSFSNKNPIRATAVIAPTKPIIKPIATSTSNRKGLFVPSQPKTAGQQSQGPVRPIAASSPNTTLTGAPSHRPGSNQTTPSRSRYGVNVRSSGYGPQQNLNSTFGSNQPLKSPNKATSTTANIKPAALPKSLKTGVPSLAGKLDFGSKGGGPTTARTGITALRPGGKLPVPGSTGLRRPTTASAVSTAVGGNKENKPRSGTATTASRIGGGLRPPHRQ